MPRKKIRHIGVIRALCNPKIPAGLREDLGGDRYRQLGVRERFKDELPYRICVKCIRAVEKRER